MGKVEYVISLDGVADGRAEFTVSRSVTGEKNLSNQPTPWVQVVCGSDDLDPDETPVLWGTWDSPTGTAQLPASGDCRAYVSLQPWREKVNSNVVEFSA